MFFFCHNKTKSARATKKKITNPSRSSNIREDRKLHLFPMKEPDQICHWDGQCSVAGRNVLQEEKIKENSVKNGFIHQPERFTRLLGLVVVAKINYPSTRNHTGEGYADSHVSRRKRQSSVQYTTELMDLPLAPPSPSAGRIYGNCDTDVSRVVHEDSPRLKVDRRTPHRVQHPPQSESTLPSHQRRPD